MLRRITLFALLTSPALALTAPTGASATTTLGETFTPAGCAPDTYIQTADPGDRYRIPFDGVITRWSYQSDSTPPTIARLKVGRIAPGADLSTSVDITITGQSDPQFPAPSTLNTYPTRIAVTAGDRIGEFVTDDCSVGNPLYTDHFFEADVQPGQTQTFSQENFKQDIAALLEADCDRDGLGDDSQDADKRSCLPATGQRAAALKKCKKKAKKKHWSMKRLKKCKKKARKLPR